jgi:hypothetical protein
VEQVVVEQAGRAFHQQQMQLLEQQIPEVVVVGVVGLERTTVWAAQAALVLSSSKSQIRIAQSFHRV